MAFLASAFVRSASHAVSVVFLKALDDDKLGIAMAALEKFSDHLAFNYKLAFWSPNSYSFSKDAHSSKCMQALVLTADPATLMALIPTPLAAVAGQMISPPGEATHRNVAR